MMSQRLKSRKGQSTVEYMILVAAVIAVLITFLNGSSSPFRTALNGVYNSMTNTMTNMSGRLANSYTEGDSVVTQK